MKKGMSAIAIIAIILAIIAVAFIGWWQYDSYKDRQELIRIENEIMDSVPN